MELDMEDRKVQAGLVILALLIVLFLILPATVGNYTGKVPNATTKGWRYLDGQDESGKKYLGLVKTHTRVYETLDGRSARLYIVGVDSAFGKPSVGSMEGKLIETVEKKASSVGVRLKAGPTQKDTTVQGSDGKEYEWTAEVTSKVFFQVPTKTEVVILAIVWESDNSSIIGLGYGLKSQEALIRSTIKSVEEIEA